MRKPNRPPTLPTASERETQARSYSYTLDGTVLSLTQAALKQLTIHRRDAVSASRRERRRMAAILRDDRLQARINKAIQRQLDKVERHAPPKKIRICVEPQNRRAFRRKERKIATSKSFFDLPSYDGPIIDRQGRQGIVMTLEYDGAKKHSFGIVGRRIVYISDPDHCELDILGRAIFISNMGGHLAEILMGADLVELAQRESRADAKLDVSIIIQLPHDVPQEVRVAIMKAVSHELFGRHSLPFAASLHRPDPNGDQRNYHCHIVGSWRPMTRTAPYSWEIAEDYRSDLDGAAYWRHARRRVAEIMTGTLERAGTERHYTHLSNAERGLPHKPQKKLDKRKTRTAREGDFVADVEANRRTMEANIALAKALETKREERRKRAFKRSLAAIARVELARVSKLDLRPVTHVESGLSAPKLGPVMASQTTTAPARGAVESVRAPSRSAPAIAAPFGITVHLRKVAPTTPNWPTTKPVAPVFSPAHDLSEKVRPIAETKPRIQSDASIKPVAAIFPRVAPILRPVGPPVAKHTRIPIERVQPKVLSEGLAGVVQPVRKPAPATANVRPVGKPETADVTLRPVEVARVTHGVPRIEPVSGGSDRGVTGTTVRPVVRPSSRLPLVVPVRRAEPPAQAKVEPVFRPTVKPPVIAKVTASITTAGPKLGTISPVPPAASVRIPMAAVIPVDPPKEQAGTGAALGPVRPAASSARLSNLRPVGPPRRVGMPDIRTVSPKAEKPATGPVVTCVDSPRIEAASAVRPIDRAVARGIDPALAETMRAFAERLASIAASRSGKRNPDASSAREKAPTIMADSAKSASDAPLQDELAREVQAARAFIDRVGNAAIHVGTDDDGMVLPMPVYWPENGLTRHGLSDPRVQAELVRMEQRQADYMKRIHPILRKTVTATLLAKGHSAIIEELPEAERAEARAWAATGIWTKLMRWVTEEGGRRSRRKLRCWRKARDLADGSQFVAAAKAEAQWKRWPVDLAPDDRRQLGEDARQHRARLAAQQTASRQAGIG
jgi:hypothetical protein|tara:strand:- start:1441 stop:4488 length:3048 start_codon:yes stop_codon:yes gene_type:complete